jgi:hypothetical protein
MVNPPGSAESSMEDTCTIGGSCTGSLNFIPLASHLLFSSPLREKDEDLGVLSTCWLLSTRGHHPHLDLESPLMLVLATW